MMVTRVIRVPDNIMIRIMLNVMTQTTETGYWA